MFRVIAVVVASVVVCSVVSADIMQDQTFTVGLTNKVDLMHGLQQADGTNMLFINNDQLANKCCEVWGGQSQFGAITQIGSACGDCALILLMQNLTATGIQTQLIGDCVEPKAQGQGLLMMTTQGIAKTDGPGGGNATTSAILNQDQTGVNVAGKMSEGSSVIALQSQNIHGDPCATGAVMSTMTVGTTQTQIVN